MMSKEELATASEEKSLRAALVAMPVADPGPGFAEQVVSRSRPTPRGRPPRPRKGIALGGLVAAAAGIVAVTMISGRSGKIAADARTEARLGQRATMVAEPGAEVSWELDGSTATVRQDAGNVFYRVNPGGTFAVSTPSGTVEVKGTCFRVEVEEMKVKSAAALGSLGGAAFASLVLVTVYEGRVVAAGNDGQSVSVSAGEQAELTPRGALRVGQDQQALAGKKKKKKRPPVWVHDQQDPKAGRGESLEALPRDLLVARARKLERENQQLTAANRVLEEKASDSKKPSFFDPGPEKLAEMAKDCMVAWDNTSMGVKPAKLREETASAVGLTEPEVDIVNAKFAESNGRLKDVVQSTYTAVTGDDRVGSMATQAMLAEIRDKTEEAEIKRIFQRLSHERAGLIPPPVDQEGMTAAEKLFRMMTSEGDRLEASIAEELGEATAHSVRAQDNGWNSRSRSSHGCPK